MRLLQQVAQELGSVQRSVVDVGSIQELNIVGGLVKPGNEGVEIVRNAASIAQGAKFIYMKTTFDPFIQIIQKYNQAI